MMRRDEFVALFIATAVSTGGKQAADAGAEGTGPASECEAATRSDQPAPLRRWREQAAIAPPFTP